MRFHVLGTLTVYDDDGATVRVAGTHRRRLLALLIARVGRPVGFDALVDGMWGECPPASAVKTLQSHATRLRQALDPDARLIRSVPGGYQLDVDPLTVDAITFEKEVRSGRDAVRHDEPDRAIAILTHALDRWRGEAYAEFRSSDVLIAEGVRLAELREAAIEYRIEAELASGATVALIPDLEHLVAAHPMREHAWELLMLAYYRSGRQAEALRAFTRARDWLREELGLEAGPGLRELESAILRQDPALDGPRRAVAAATITIPPTPSADAPRFVGQCPYRGLSTFEADDAELFAGRDRLTSELVAAVTDHRITVVVGPSGGGKSSLVRAGLLPALKAGAISGSDRWRTVVMTPTDRPLTAYDAGLAALAEGCAPALVVVDQFEELYGSRVADTDRHQFIERLLDLAYDPTLDCRVVLVVRGDYYGHLASHSTLAQASAEATLLVGPCSAEELRQTIETPAQRAGLRVEPGLTTLLLRETERQPAALPLLSTALVATWERQHDGVLRVGDLLDAGGLAGAIERLGERALADLSPDDVEAARRVLVRLAEPTDDGRWVRRRAAIDEIVADERSRRALDALVERRIVTIHHDVVEVTHETVFEGWPRLAGWLGDAAADRRVLTALSTQARAWAGGGRDDLDLLRGTRLQAALEWLSHHADDVHPIELEYIDTSERRALTDQQAARRQAEREVAGRRRLRRVTAALAVALAAALVVGAVAVGERQTARRERDASEAAALYADSQRLTAAAQTEAEPERALLFAEAARRLDDNMVTRAGVVQSLERFPALRRVLLRLPVGRRPLHIDVSPIHGLAAVVDNQGGIHVIDPNDATQRSFQSGTWAFDALWSPDGSTLAIAGDPVGLQWWSKETGNLEDSADSVGLIAKMAWSPDGRRLAAATLEGELVVLDPGSHDELQRWTPPFAEGRLSEPPFLHWTDAGLWLIGGDEVVLVEPRSGAVQRRFPLAGAVFPDVAPDGAFLAAVVDDSVVVLDLATGRERRWTAHPGLQDVSWSNDGDRIVSSGDDDTLAIWDAATGGLIERMSGHDDRVVASEFSAAGDRAYSVSIDRGVFEWDVTGTSRLRQVIHGAADEQRPGRWSVSPDSRSAILAGDDGVLRRIDVASGAVLTESPRYPADSVRALVETRRHVLVSGDGFHLADPDSLALRRTLTDLPAPLDAWADAGPDDSVILTVLDDSMALRTFQITLDGDTRELQQGRLGAVATTLDGDIVEAGVAENGTIEVRRIDPLTGGIERGAQLPAACLDVVRVDIDPRTGDPAIACVSGEVLLLDDQLAERDRFVASDGFALSTSWSPDGTTIVTGATDGTVRLFDVATLRQLLELRSPGNVWTSPVWVDPDTIAVEIAEAVVVRYDLGPAELGERVCSIANRDLTAHEWADTIGDRPFAPIC